jgi:putative DNA primase/helicase
LLLRVIEGLDSYTELSPSGKGVHVIAKGQIPHGGRRGAVEMYCQDRFFTVTGHVLGEGG